MHEKPKNQSQIIDDFIAGATEGVCGGGANLKIQGNQLIHYQTVIAERTEENIVLNHTRYSIVTGRIQKMIREKVSDKFLVSVGKVPEGYKDSLTIFLKD